MLFRSRTNVLSEITTSLKGRKIAVIKPILDLLLNKTIVDEFNKLVAKLEKAGAIVHYVPFDEALLKAILPTYIVLSCAEASASNASLDGINFGATKPGDSYEEIVTNTRQAGFSPNIKARLILGNYALKKENRGAYYDRAQKARRLIVEAINKLFNDYDALLLPAAPTSAPLVGTMDDERLVVANNYLAIGNFGGLPSVTVPFYLEEGLPVGVNITCKAFADAAALNIAYQIEEITGFYNLNAEESK